MAKIAIIFSILILAGCDGLPDRGRYQGVSGGEGRIYIVDTQTGHSVSCLQQSCYFNRPTGERIKKFFSVSQNDL